MSDLDNANVNENNDEIKDQNSIDERDEKIAELDSAWKRALADYKNLERRFNEERVSLVKFSNLVLIEKLLPLHDNLDSLNKHISDKGLEMVSKQFCDILKAEGLEEIEALDKDFDPMTMQAVELIEGQGEEKDNKVVEVIRKGFRLGDKIIRPAFVKVGKK